MNARIRLIVNERYGGSLDLVTQFGEWNELVEVLDTEQQELISRNAKHKRHDESNLAAIEHGNMYTWKIEHLTGCTS